MTPTPSDLLQAAMAKSAHVRVTCTLANCWMCKLCCVAEAALAEIAAYEAWALNGYQPGDVLGVKLSEARAARVEATRVFVEGK